MLRVMTAVLISYSMASSAFAQDTPDGVEETYYAFPDLLIEGCDLQFIVPEPPIPPHKPTFDAPVIAKRDLWEALLATRLEDVIRQSN